MIIPVAVSSYEVAGNDICSGSKLPDIEHLDDSIVLGVDSDNFQASVDYVSQCSYVWIRFCTFNIQDFGRPD